LMQQCNAYDVFSQIFNKYICTPQPLSSDHPGPLAQTLMILQQSEIRCTFSPWSALNASAPYLSSSSSRVTMRLAIQRAEMGKVKIPRDSLWPQRTKRTRGFWAWQALIWCIQSITPLSYLWLMHIMLMPRGTLGLMAALFSAWYIWRERCVGYAITNPNVNPLLENLMTIFGPCLHSDLFDVCHFCSCTRLKHDDDCRTLLEAAYLPYFWLAHRRLSQRGTPLHACTSQNERTDLLAKCLTASKIASAGMDPCAAGEVRMS